jgi:hypothetical protein
MLPARHKNTNKKRVLGSKNHFKRLYKKIFQTIRNDKFSKFQKSYTPPGVKYAPFAAQKTQKHHQEKVDGVILNTKNNVKILLFTRTF